LIRRIYKLGMSVSGREVSGLRGRSLAIGDFRRPVIGSAGTLKIAVCSERWPPWLPFVGRSAGVGLPVVGPLASFQEYFL
jgi:hypothetical protein